MDHDNSSLVFQLCTQIGMIMEDASAIALLRRETSRESIAAQVDELELASQRIAALVAAAKALI